MKIKSATQPSFIKNGLLLAALLVLVLSGGFFLKKQEKLHTSTYSPSAQTIDFFSKKSTLKEVLGFFHDHTILLSVKDDASIHFPKNIRDELAAIGGDTLAQLGVRDSYAGVFQNGRFVKESLSSTEPVTLKWGGNEVTSAGNDKGNFSKILVNTVQHSSKNRGLNLYVVSPENQLVGTWCFDFFETATPLSTAMNWLDGDVEKLAITLSEKQYRKLEKKRDGAKNDFILLNSPDDFLPAHIDFKGKKYDVQMRLKGDWTDHLEDDQWSFRVKIDDGTTLLGMRKFSLHRPGTRNFAGEWLFHQVLADAGILNLQYHFIKVELKIEGKTGSEIKNLGIYALEEGFDKQLVERNQRRAGVILKLDESLMWEEMAAFMKNRKETPEIDYIDFQKYKQMKIVPFSENQVWADSTLYKQYLTGSSFFRDFIDGKKQLSEVFDLKLTAKYVAISHLLNANHALAGHNYRVYYNPVTSKLEPIGFDGNAGSKVYGFIDFHNTRQDVAFQEAYVKAVEEITRDDYVQRLAHWPGLQDMVSIMKSVYAEYELTEDIFIHNQRMLQSFVHPKQPLRINFNGIKNGYFHVDIENFSRLPMEVSDLTYNGKKVFGKTEKRTILPANTRTQVAFKLDVDYEKVFTKKSKQKVGFNPHRDMEKVQVRYRTVGSQFPFLERVLLWSADRGGLAKKDPFQRDANAHQFPFLVFDEKAKTITCPAGKWALDAPLTIPPGYTFVALPGAQLDLLGQFVSIFSYSPLRFIGTPDNPVEVISNSRLGKGMLVLNTPDTSVLRYCKFTGLANPSTEGWSVTGAVNFYEADVKLEHCLFSENRCEDALNILRCHFEMKDCLFSDIHADAFDGDFVTGTVKDCVFNNIGNDGIDLSGSKIGIKNVAIDKAGDKGISAGEDSHISASQIVIKNSEIAIASKDKSIFNITKAVLENNKLAFTAFQKKPEFGPAEIKADSVEIKNGKRVHLIENGSSLLLNGKMVETVEKVLDRMYGVEYGKKSE